MSKPGDHYTTLGVSIDATSAQIDDAFRRATKYHDLTKSDGGHSPREFQRILHAYQIISDPRRRHAYDTGLRAMGYQQPHPAFATPRAGQGGTTRKPSESSIMPTMCTRCRRATTYPIHAGFLRTDALSYPGVKIITATYCEACAGKAALEASMHAFLRGWWRLPSGIPHTLKAILTNAGGGLRHLGIEEQMRWHNVVAYHALGRLRLALALATTLQTSKIISISSRARDYVSYMKRERKIVAAPVGPPRGPALSSRLSQTAMAISVPVLIGLGAPLLLQGGPGQFLGAFGKSWSDPTNECVALPSTGTIIAGGAALLGFGELTIKNGTSGAAIVKVKQLRTGRLLVSFFVARGEATTLPRIPDDTYDVQFVVGNALDPTCSRIKDGTPMRFQRPIQFTTERTASGKLYRRLDVTLYGVVGGTAKVLPLASREF